MKVFAVLALTLAVAAAKPNLLQSEIYSGCGDFKNCIGNMPGCVETEDCILVQTYSNNGDGTYNFEVQSMEEDVDNGSGWVAAGWGFDDVMGDDTVVMCNDFTDSADLYWNVFANETIRFPVMVEDFEGSITLGAVQAGTGTLYCSFTRSAELAFVAPDSGEDTVNNLDTTMYRAMASTGVTDADGNPTHHTKAAVSDQDFDFSA